MASSASDWRQRIEQRLQVLEADADATAALLESVVGSPSPELEQLLAAGGVPAAVLICLIESGPDIKLLLTQRAAHLPYHPGQISFPGGRLADPEETPIAAALREANEEVGLEPSAVAVLGALRPRLTGTGFNITPVVGWLGQPFEPTPDPGEVEFAFEVPLAHLLAPGARQSVVRERLGTRFRVHEYQYREHRIWGATAAIISEFVEIIND